MKQIEKQINDLQNQIDLLRVELEEKAKQNKIDFSILNDEDWFYVEMEDFNFLSLYRNLDVKFKVKVLFDLCKNELRFSTGIESNKIVLTLRKATPEDLKPLYKNHPELEPPKIGDLCVFWDENEDLIEQESILINYLKKIYTHHDYIYISNNINWKYAMKILPTVEYWRCCHHEC